MKFIRKYKYVITIVMLGIIIGWGYLVKRDLEKNSEVMDDEVVQEVVLEEMMETAEIKEEELVTVDIKGAVKKPGVYTVEKSAIVNDVIELAGGLTKNADTSLINLSKIVSNEMVIIIYTKEEVKNSNIVDTVIQVVEKECVCPNIQNDGCINTEIEDEISNQGGLVNINTASLDELMTLPGIGQTKAEAIISYRETTKFTSVEDILKVSGFGDKLYEQIKIYITT